MSPTVALDMADLSSLSKRPGGMSRLGPPMLGAAAALFVLTRIIVWLPLGFVGSFINGILWPFILLGVLVGGFLTWRKFAKSAE
jgi:hypothetical protein